MRPLIGERPNERNDNLTGGTRTTADACKSGAPLTDCSERIHNLSPQIQSISLANFILATNNSFYCKPMKRFPRRPETGAFSPLRSRCPYICNIIKSHPLRLFYCTVEKKSMLINSQRCSSPLTNVYKEKSNQKKRVENELAYKLANKSVSFVTRNFSRLI